MARRRFSIRTRKDINGVMVLIKVVISVFLLTLLYSTTTSVAKTLNGTSTNNTEILKALGFNFGYHDATTYTVNKCTDCLNGSLDSSVDTIFGMIGLLIITWIILDLVRIRIF